MVFGRDFFWVVLQFGAWMRGPGFKIGLFGNCHAANGVSPEVFPDQFVWIAVGQECATTYGPINNACGRRLCDRNPGETPVAALTAPPAGQPMPSIEDSKPADKPAAESTWKAKPAARERPAKVRTHRTVKKKRERPSMYASEYRNVPYFGYRGHASYRYGGYGGGYGRVYACAAVVSIPRQGAVADVVEIWMTLSSAFSGYRVMRQRQAFADPS